MKIRHFCALIRFGLDAGEVHEKLEERYGTKAGTLGKFLELVNLNSCMCFSSEG